MNIIRLTALASADVPRIAACLARAGITFRYLGKMRFNVCARYIVAADNALREANLTLQHCVLSSR